MRHGIASTILLSVSCLLLTACMRGENASQRLDSLEAVTQHLQTRVDSLNSDVDSLSAELFLKELTIDQALSGTAILNPAQDGYSILSTELGPLAFSVSETAPNANGSTATLSIGNLTGSFITEMEFQVGYRATGTAASPTQYTDLTINERLSPTTWRRREVNLPGVRPSQLGVIRISPGGDGARILFNYEE